ncbi:MAG: M48 family metallopeptidase [Gammaproteobacteria bacterium]|nr:M48 family metallopeptidase [Gammaproteobacteria bacterium]MDH5653268.1 M48 family metallopeptidase [Gammaproteobacteria bacterium]
MIKLPAYRYDGTTSNRQEVEICLFDSGEVDILIDGEKLRYKVDDITSTPKVGRIRARFAFSDGSVCEVMEHPELDAAIQMLPHQSRQNKIHGIENHLGAIAVVFVMTIVLMFVVVQYGIPAAAKQVAFMIPVEMEQSMGESTMEVFEKHLCEPSKLSDKRQTQLRKKFIGSLDEEMASRIKLIFLHCKGFGPNAFALPAGFVIFTDDIVKLAKHDNELLGVFAHEVGHVMKRHAMRHVLQNTVTGLVIVLLTGDVGSLASLAAALPTVIVQAKFSRDFETESDDYAAAFLRKRNIPTRHLGEMLERLVKKHGGDRLPDFLSSHPATRERIERLKKNH